MSIANPLWGRSPPAATMNGFQAGYAEKSVGMDQIRAAGA
jgi:hypothetical protein